MFGSRFSSVEGKALEASLYGCLCVVQQYTQLSIRAICTTLPSRS